MAKHCKGCSHPTICKTHGCAAEEARRNIAKRGAPSEKLRAEPLSIEACKKLTQEQFGYELTGDDLRLIRAVELAHGIDYRGQSDRGQRSEGLL